MSDETRWEGKGIETRLFSFSEDEVDHPLRMVPKEIALEQEVIRVGRFSGALHVLVWYGVEVAIEAESNEYRVSVM